MSESLRRMMLVWLALIGLLGLTIGASFVPMGPVQPVASYGIAFAKAALVVWFFMEFRQEGGIARIAGLTGVVWLVFLFCLIVADTATRGWHGG